MILKKRPANKKIISVSECICFDKKGKLILLRKKKSHKKYPWRWGFPAGRLEKDEKPLAGIKREFKEETGLLLRDKEFILLSPKPTYHHHSGSDGTSAYVRIFTYGLAKKVDIKKIKIDKNEHDLCDSFGMKDFSDMDKKRMLMPDTYKIKKMFSSKFKKIETDKIQ